MVFILDLLIIMVFIIVSIVYSFNYKGNEYHEDRILNTELVYFLQNNIPLQNGYNSALRNFRMNADSLALESAYSIGKFFPIKEDSLHKLFFCGQDHPIAFWILYNKKQKKVESIKSDCFEEAAEDITVREKYNAALAILKKKLSHKFYYDEHMNPVPLIYDSLYINLYKADPPQWLIDSLQKDVSYEVLPKSKLETNGNFNVNKISVKSPLYVVDNFEIISCSTGVILFGIYKNHYNRYEMIKANGKWWTGETYDNGLSWINMREREKNIQNIFREERVHKPETRK